MAELKGSRTEANLRAAFSGESEARNKYTFFASQAKKEGYEQISAIFNETADNEKEHAKIWFKLLSGISDTQDNLVRAAKAKTTNGRRCTRVSRKRLMRKGSKILRRCLKESPRSKRNMKPDT